jgi:hypothetical protein
MKIFLGRNKWMLILTHFMSLMKLDLYIRSLPKTTQKNYKKG